MESDLPPLVQPADMMVFPSVETFRPHANNFYLMFLEMGTDPLIKNIYRHRPAFWRFAVAYPERFQQLQVLLEEEGRYPGERSWPLLLEAYNLMAQLVDVGDPGVVTHQPYPERDPVTGIDRLHLTR